MPRPLRRSASLHGSSARHPGRRASTFPPLRFALFALTLLVAAPSTLVAEGSGDGAARATSIGERRITFDEILSGGVRLGARLPRANFDADGDAVGLDGRWVTLGSDEEVEPTLPSPEPTPALDGLEEVRFTDGVERSFPRRGRQLSRDGRVVLAEVGDGLVYRRADEDARWIPASEDRSIVTLDPTGGHASWVAGNDLWIADLDDARPMALTTSGSADRFHGRLDWVYQEEVYGRGNFRGHWWSPTGEHLAWLSLDETEVPTFSIVDHLPARQRRTDMRYPKAGDPNPIVSVHLLEVGTGRRVEVDLSRFGAGDEILVVRVDWSPSGDRLLLQVQDRIQTWLELVEVRVDDASSRTLLREESESWVNVLGSPRWLSDGRRFLWYSERSGFKHVHLHDGESLRAVTGGDWQVNSILSVDEERGELWLSASIPSPVESHLYRVSLDGGVLTQLTSAPGSHSITIAPDHGHFIDAHSSHEFPGEVLLRDREGRLVRTLARAQAPALEEFALSIPERRLVPARDGYPLEVMVTKPVPFDPERPHPVLLMTYSGPDAPTVRDRWRLDPWQQFLAQQGVVILQVNNRSSSGRGQVDTAACYLRLGESELQDLVDAVDWLTAQPWADRSRVGITGWSYGGFMAAYALTHSDRFALGLAGAGVYDWRLYDTIYTERYMSTPERNPDGYRDTSVIGAAADLEGHLVIVHGVDDDNVHVQNAMQLAHALQRAEKSFELMLYPGATHGIRDGMQRRHHRRLQWSAIEEHLLGRAASDRGGD
jgi:dipeptidyl-peptidase-4